MIITEKDQLKGIKLDLERQLLSAQCVEARLNIVIQINDIDYLIKNME